MQISGSPLYIYFYGFDILSLKSGLLGSPKLPFLFLQISKASVAHLAPNAHIMDHQATGFISEKVMDDVWKTSFSGSIRMILFQVHKCEKNGKVTSVIENFTVFSHSWLFKIWEICAIMVF